jgi:hypothetical protein
MALALLTASLVSLVCLLATAVMGFMMPDHAGLAQHFMFGLFTTFMVTLAQSMTMFYFIGTGKQVKELVANRPAAADFIQRTKRFKAKIFPPAVWAMLFTMSTTIIGGGVDTRVIPAIVHSGLAAAALYFNIVAFWREAKYMIEQNILMEEIDRLLQTPGTALPATSLDGSAHPPDGCALSRLHSLRSSPDGCALSRLHSAHPVQ